MVHNGDSRSEIYILALNHLVLFKSTVLFQNQFSKAGVKIWEWIDVIHSPVCHILFQLKLFDWFLLSSQSADFVIVLMWMLKFSSVSMNTSSILARFVVLHIRDRSWALTFNHSSSAYFYFSFVKLKDIVARVIIDFFNVLTVLKYKKNSVMHNYDHFKFEQFH